MDVAAPAALVPTSLFANMLARVARSRLPATARALSGYPQPPLSQGPGGKDGAVPSDLEQATGREREEILARTKGIEYFNRLRALFLAVAPLGARAYGAHAVQSRSNGKGPGHVCQPGQGAFAGARAGCRH